MDSLGFAIAHNSYFIIEHNETYFLMRIVFFDLVELRLDRTQNALFAGNKCFVLVLGSWQVVKLGLIAWFHELFEHVYLLLA